MISKERLKELIEQKAKIYSTHWQEEVDLSLPCEIVESEYDNKTITHLVVFEDEEHTPSYMIDNLTEDIESAKWAEEFKRIPRTDYLDLPTWEEFDKSEKLVRFIGKNGGMCKLEGYFNLDLQSGFIDVVENGSSQLSLSEYTKENYTLACRKAKQLFLGEEEQ